MLTCFPCSRWFTSSDKRIAYEGESSPVAFEAIVPGPSFSIHNKTNNITNIVAPTVAVAAVVESDSDD